MVFGETITVSMGLKKGWDNYKEWRDGFLDIDELDGYRQQFADELEGILTKILDCEITIERIIDRFEEHREEILSTLGDQKITDIDTAVGRLTERMEDAVINELDTDSADHENIRKAIETAYRETLDKFIEDLSEGQRHRLTNELSRVVQEDIYELKDSVEELSQRLEYDSKLLGRQEPFTIAETDSEISKVTEDLRTGGDSSNYSYHAPPSFAGTVDAETVLYVGRKGTGKSRALYESVSSVTETHSFDKVIHIGQGYRNTSDLGSLAHQKYDGDVLLIWDDAHRPRNQDVVIDLIDKLRSYIGEESQDTLWVRMTARRTGLDHVIDPGHGSTQRSTEISVSPLAADSEPVHLLPVDSEAHLNRDTISELVAESLDRYEIESTDDLQQSFVDAILSYEPTPEYIHSACQQIAANSGSLSETNIESLPDTTQEIWAKAYSRLRNDSQYGDGRRSILKSIAVLDWLDANKITVPLVRSISRSAFESSGDFNSDLNYLESRGWITTRDSPDRIEIHDIRLEVIDWDNEDRTVLNGISQTLLKLADQEIPLPSQMPTDFPSSLNSAFAQRLQSQTSQENLTSELIEDHFEVAVFTATATPAVHQDYAEYLESVGRVEEARTQHFIAKEIRPNDDVIDDVIRGFTNRVREQRGAWDPGRKDNAVIEPSEGSGRPIEDTITSSPNGPNVSPAARDMVDFDDDPNRSHEFTHEAYDDSPDQRNVSPAKSPDHPHRESPTGHQRDYPDNESRCQECGTAIKQGRNLCLEHRKERKELSAAERQRSLARQNRQQRKAERAAIKQLYTSDIFTRPDVDDNLFHDLWEIRSSIDDDVLSYITDPETITGVITAVTPVAEFQDNSTQDTSSSEQTPDAENDFIAKRLREEIFSVNAIEEAFDDTLESYLTVLVEVDTGTNKVLAVLDQDTTTEVLNISRQEAREEFIERFSMDSFYEEFTSSIEFEYCYLQEFPGSTPDQLVLPSSSDRIESISVDTISLFDGLATSNRVEHPLIAGRTTASEVRDAHESVRSGQLAEFESTLLPTGGRTGRVCLCGYISEPTDHDDISSWARLDDSFGESIVLYESFQNSTMTPLHTEENQLDPEAPVLVTGSVETFSTSADDVETAIHVTDITNIPLETCYYLTVEIGHQTIARIDGFDADPGISQLSQYKYDIDSTTDLTQYRDLADSYTDLIA